MEKLMNAIVKAAPGKGLELRQVPVPVPGPGEILIKVHKTAICGTDVHIYNWDPWAVEHIKPPMTIGHEYVGEVAALGPGVTGLRIGQRVSGEGHITCVLFWNVSLRLQAAARPPLRCGAIHIHPVLPL